MKYSALDIHRMRRTIGLLWSMDNRMSYKDVDRQVAVEARLVTYMSNETTPDELAAEYERRCKLGEHVTWWSDDDD